MRVSMLNKRNKLTVDVIILLKIIGLFSLKYMKLVKKKGNTANFTKKQKAWNRKSLKTKRIKSSTMINVNNIDLNIKDSSITSALIIILMIFFKIFYISETNLLPIYSPK